MPRRQHSKCLLLLQLCRGTTLSVIIHVSNLLWWWWCCSVVSNYLQPHRLQPTRFLCPWNFLGKNTGVCCHFLLQGIFPTQGLNLGLRHCRQVLYCLRHQGKLIENWVFKKCGMSIQNTLKKCLQRGRLYGQATQDGCSLAFCTYQAMLSQCLLHLHAAHRTDLPIYLPKAPTSDCSYQRGSEAHAPLCQFPW